MTSPFRIDAPAKINLALHVTGQRGDGYHTIETIAVFADIGDRVEAAPAPRDSFAIVGPEGAALADENPDRNLVILARDMLRAIVAGAGQAASPVALTLDKRLPAGSGIGGGSADAAATLRALAELWNCADLAGTIADSAASLGADVPMCLASTPLIATGIGEAITHLDAMPALPMVLANPRIHVSTPTVFAALSEKHNPQLALDGIAALRTPADWVEWLTATTRNDLEPPSRSLAPEITTCLAELRETGAALARMSGSGATCFAIHETPELARAAASHLLHRHPDWWIKACMTQSSEAGTP